MARRGWVWATAVWTCACGDTVEPTFDGSVASIDATARDSGTRDAEPFDAGPTDSGFSDAGFVDAGPSDAGAPDGGDDCSVAGVDGLCTDVAMCSEAAAFRAECAGVPRRTCCIADAVECSVDGAPGLCLDVAACRFTSTPGRCPGAANIQCCADPSRACDPTIHEFPNETLVEESWDTRCPDGMVFVTDFCIDRYEASLVELDGDGNEIGTWSPYHFPGSTPVKAQSIAGAVPQGYINGVAASAACVEAGKQLCTDAQWLRACRGSGDRIYPYGDTREPGRCNDARGRHPAIEFFGSSEPWVFGQIDNACINQIPAALDLTGQNDGCETESGAFDMMGNLHEWTADPAGTFRGGFYTDTMINGEGCLYRTVAHSTAHWDYSTGFRCCASPN